LIASQRQVDELEQLLASSERALVDMKAGRSASDVFGQAECDTWVTRVNELQGEVRQGKEEVQSLREKAQSTEEQLAATKMDLSSTARRVVELEASWAESQRQLLDERAELQAGQAKWINQLGDVE